MAGKRAARMCALHSLWAMGSCAFVSVAPLGSSWQGRAILPALRESEVDSNGEASLDSKECGKFKILTCSSTSCSKMREDMGIDEFAIFGSIYERKTAANADEVQVEESSCLGSCKLAPCVAVEHEDFVGSVSLEGMTPAEFNARSFHRVINEDDVDRVWQSVEGAIRVMAQGEIDEDDED